jgi:hypothetical protein
MLKFFKRLLHSRTTAGFSLEYNGKASLYRNGHVALGINFSSDFETEVVELCIEVGNMTFHALGWEPFSFSGQRKAIFKFDLNQIISSAGEGSLKELILRASADGGEYSSPSFNLAFLIK